MAVALRWVWAAALAACACPTAAQEKIVPIEEEPKHVLKFQNRHVRFFDVQLPPGYERVRVTRIMIGPGERLALHPTCGMLVAVSEAQLAFRSLGPEERISIEPAGFKWRDAYDPVTLVNVGQTVFHGVDIVVK